MTRNSGIIAYGTLDDRHRLAAIVKSLNKRSGSELIIEMIRQRYTELFGDLNPGDLPHA